MYTNIPLLFHFVMAILFAPQVFAYDQDYSLNFLKPKSELAMEYNKMYSPGLYGNSLFNPYKSLGVSLHNSYLRNAIPLEEEFSFEKLIGLIQSQNLTTIESVIEALPDTMKNQNYILMYRSRSLQDASPSQPRALLYTPTASFILSFNGGGKQLGGNSIETIQFRHDQRRFEFHEIVFDGVSRPQVSEANPAKCMECHQSPSRKEIDYRPNWEPYSVWVGAYGSDAGHFNSRPLSKKYDLLHRIEPQDKEILDEQADELDNFIHYIKKVAPKHPRYSKLGEFSVRGPTDLSNHLAYWNFMRVMRLMQNETEIYKNYDELIEYIALCGENGEHLKNSRAFQWHQSFEYPQYYDFPYRGDANTLSGLITSIFEPLGVDTSDWSMDFGSGARFTFRERFGTPSNTHQVFRSIWQTLHPDHVRRMDYKCNELGARAIAKIDQAYAQGFQQSYREEQMSLSELQAPRGENIVMRCARCHAEGGDSRVPFIPFDQPDELAKALERNSKRRTKIIDEIRFRTSDMATKKEQMPPRGRLSRTEHEALIKYLEEIRNDKN